MTRRMSSVGLVVRLVWLLLALGGVGQLQALVVLQVNPTAADASDEAVADPASRPFRTIAAASQAALALAGEGVEAHVEIAPGVYREQILLVGEPDVYYAPIELRAAPGGGEVLISGAELLEGWRIGREGYFEVPWTEDLGEEPSFYVEGVRVIFRPEARVIAAGQAMHNRERGLAQMLPPQNAVVKVGSVEVAVRGELLRASGLTVLRLRGLNFGQGRLDAGDRALVTISTLSELLMEKCRIEHGSRGLSILQSGGVDLNGVSVSRCRSLGAVVQDAGEVIIRGGEFILNGQRQESGFGLFVSDVFTLIMNRVHIAENGTGAVLEDIAVEAELTGLTVYANHGLGMSLEQVANASMRQVQFAQNKGGALALGHTRARLNGCVLADNGQDEGVAIRVGDGAELELVNSIISNRPAYTATLLAVADEGGYTEGAGNLFFSSDETKSFRVNGLVGGLEEWHRHTGQDGNSHFADPLFIGADRYDFIPARGSPWFTRSQWPPVGGGAAEEEGG